MLTLALWSMSVLTTSSLPRLQATIRAVLPSVCCPAMQSFLRQRLYTHYGQQTKPECRATAHLSAHKPFAGQLAPHQHAVSPPQPPYCTTRSRCVEAMCHPTAGWEAVASKEVLQATHAVGSDNARSTESVPKRRLDLPHDLHLKADTLCSLPALRACTQHEEQCHRFPDSSNRASSL
jgi:hypothetical protein